MDFEFSSIADEFVLAQKQLNQASVMAVLLQPFLHHELAVHHRVIHDLLINRLVIHSRLVLLQLSLWRHGCMWVEPHHLSLILSFLGVESLQMVM